MSHQNSPEENKKLIEKYPFLLPHNRFSDEVPEDYYYSFTELDFLPDGWRIAFGNQMLDELLAILQAGDFVNEYRIVQIKEKFASLRIYDNGVPNSIAPEYEKWLAKYEDLSLITCIGCGAPATGYTRGWIVPYCDECAAKENKTLNKEIDL